MMGREGRLWGVLRLALLRRSVASSCPVPPAGAGVSGGTGSVQASVERG